jgi:hypothetical protein
MLSRRVAEGVPLRGELGILAYVVHELGSPQASKLSRGVGQEDS